MDKSIFISSFNGLILAAKYSNYFLIMNALQNLMAAVIPAMTASVGNSIVLENEKKNYKDFRIINFMYTWLGGWISICLLCMYQPFIELWMGKDMQLPFYTMLLFCVCLFINANEDMLSLYIQATGLWGKTKKIAVNSFAEIKTMI